MAESKSIVLVVEDDDSIANFIYSMLNTVGYFPIIAKDGTQAKSLIVSYTPDVVLLDLGLPDMDGMDFLKWLRGWSELPVIVVSARSREAEKVTALDAGADDYITKPFGVSELTARIRAALRHSEKKGELFKDDMVITSGDLTIDTGKRKVTVGSKEIKLTVIEYKIVSLLGKYIGRVLTHEFIMKEVWGPYTASDNQILRVNMANIRRKLEANPAEPKYIVTELGVGYRMLED